MADEYKYERIHWEDYPKTSTPLNAGNLNKMDEAIEKAHERLDNIDEALIANIEVLTDKEILEAIGASSVTYYFKNTLKWSPVYFYTWYTVDQNDLWKRAWPGEPAELVESLSDGDIYKVVISTQYTHIIFNNGTGTGKVQTVNIPLAGCDSGTLFICGSTNSEGKYTFTTGTYTEIGG